MNYYTTADAQLRKTVDEMTRATGAQLARLQKLWPVGTRVTVLLSRRQRVASHATITGHRTDCYGGCITVHLDNEKQFSRYRHRSIATNMICEVLS